MALKAKSKKSGKTVTGHKPVKPHRYPPRGEETIMDKTLVTDYPGPKADGATEVSSENVPTEHTGSEMEAGNVEDVSASQSEVEGATEMAETKITDEEVQPVVQNVSGVSEVEVMEAPVTEEMNNQDTVAATEESGTAKWVAVIVVLGLLIVAAAGGAFYYLTQYKYAPNQPILSPVPDLGSDVPPAADSSQTQEATSSDEIDEMTKELESVDTNGLDQEMVAIEEELPE